MTAIYEAMKKTEMKKVQKALIRHRIIRTIQLLSFISLMLSMYFGLEVNFGTMSYRASAIPAFIFLALGLGGLFATRKEL